MFSESWILGTCLNVYKLNSIILLIIRKITCVERRLSDSGWGLCVLTLWILATPQHYQTVNLNMLYYFLFFIMCDCGIWVQCPQRPAEGDGAPQLELWAFVRCPVWVLRPERGSSVRAVFFTGEAFLLPLYFPCWKHFLFPNLLVENMFVCFGPHPLKLTLGESFCQEW